MLRFLVDTLRLSKIIQADILVLISEFVVVISSELLTTYCGHIPALGARYSVVDTLGAGMGALCPPGNDFAPPELPLYIFKNLELFPLNLFSR